MRENEPKDPIARHLADAANQQKAETDVRKGEILLKADFTRIARTVAPQQLKNLKEMFEAKCESYNHEKPKGFPYLRFVPEGRVDAEKFSIVLDAFEDVEVYVLTVNIGVHPNAAQFMDEIPKIEPLHLKLHSEQNENGFFWKDVETGEGESNAFIVEKSFQALCNLLINDLRAS